MESQTVEFDLRSPVWHEQAKSERSTTRMLWGIFVVVLALTLVGLYATVRGYAESSPTAIAGLSLFLILAYVSTIVAFRVAYRGGPPPIRLRLSQQAVDLIYADGKVHFSRHWDDPEFSLTLRDFRALPQELLMSKELWLDTGDNQFFVTGFRPSRIPKSGLLTPEAYEAILSMARQRGCSITPITRRGLTGDEGWFYYHTKIQISRPGT